MAFRDRIVRRVVAAVAAGGLLAVGQVGVASAHGSYGDDHDGYHSDHRYSSIRTTTDLRVYDKYACAYVWSYKGKPPGTVTFTLYSSRYTDSATVYLRYGKACVGLSRLDPGWYKLSARYNGYGPYLRSWDSEYFKVRGSAYYDHNRDSYDHHDSYYKDDDKDTYYRHDEERTYDEHTSYYDLQKCEEWVARYGDYKLPEWCKRPVTYSSYD